MHINPNAMNSYTQYVNILVQNILNNISFNVFQQIVLFCWVKNTFLYDLENNKGIAIHSANVFAWFCIETSC